MAFPAALLKEREKLDERLVNALSFLGAKKDEGVKYARWLVIDGELGVQTAMEIKSDLKADNFFIGQIASKPLTIFFFLPEFN
jgi:hypothetical protein